MEILPIFTLLQSQRVLISNKLHFRCKERQTGDLWDVLVLVVGQLWGSSSSGGETFLSDFTRLSTHQIFSFGRDEIDDRGAGALMFAEIRTSELFFFTYAQCWLEAWLFPHVSKRFLESDRLQDRDNGLVGSQPSCYGFHIKLCKKRIWRSNTEILNQQRDQIRMNIKGNLDENDNGEVSPAGSSEGKIKATAPH